jgi:hypothetical protein
MQLNQSELEMVCGGLLNDLSGVLTWRWDDRFGALLSEFQAEKQAEVRLALESHFVHLWDRKSIRDAPMAIQNGAGHFLDLRDNQLLFTSAPAVGSLLIAAWWPWNDAKAISVRIISSAADSSPQRPWLMGKLRELFH